MHSFRQDLFPQAMSRPERSEDQILRSSAAQYLTEAWRRGIQKIKDSCIWAGNEVPEYKVKSAEKGE